MRFVNFKSVSGAVGGVFCLVIYRFLLMLQSYTISLPMILKITMVQLFP